MRKIKKTKKNDLVKNSKAIIKKKKDSEIKKLLKNYFPIYSKKLEKPLVPLDFNKMSAPQRIWESLIYFTKYVEFSISPNGGLRQYIKLNISLFLLLGIPLMVFIPIIIFVMGGFETITLSLSNIMNYLYIAALNFLKLLISLIIIATILFIIFKLIKKRMNRNNEAGDENIRMIE